MRAIIVLLPLLLVFAVGYWLGQKQAKRERVLMQSYAHQLLSLQNLRDTLSIQASEHLILGETFPTIVLDEISKQRRELEP